MYGEYLNMVISMSADEFFDMMWNQKNEIYQDILKYEEVFDFAWRKFLGLKLDGPVESRRSSFCVYALPVVLNRPFSIFRTLTFPNLDIPSSDHN